MSRTVRPKKRTANTWFIPVRGSYLPASPAGWASYVPFVAYLVFSVVAAWQHTGSLSLTVLWAVPNWVAATVALTWLAARHS